MAAVGVFILFVERAGGGREGMEGGGGGEDFIEMSKRFVWPLAYNVYILI